MNSSSGAGASKRDPAVIRQEILDRVRELHEARSADTWRPGENYLGYAGRVHDEKEIVNAVDATLDFWLTLGPRGQEFERRLAGIVGSRWSRLVNSGSSANLIAFSALTSPSIEGRILHGDEVITAAAGFPTTVAPIVQNGCVPVFVDSDPVTGNIRVDQLKDALSPRTRAVMVAHALGNPWDVDAVRSFCQDHNLWLVEDNCDALGTLYKGKPTGAFGDISTQSFYPPHHLTMGEGGAVNIVRSGPLKVAVESFRDWGRDCWCDSGKEDTCGKRYGWKLGGLPEGYDHKFIYSHIGYNLKPLDIQAAIGLAQLDKLPAFTAARRANYDALRAAIAPFREVVRPMEATAGSEPSWFGFMMVVEPGAPFTRNEMVRHLEGRKIGTRMLFGGNLVRQPAFTRLAQDCREQGRPAPFRTVGDLAGADRLMNDACFIGTYPGIDSRRRAYMIEILTDFLRERTGIAR